MTDSSDPPQLCEIYVIMMCTNYWRIRCTVLVALTFAVATISLMPVTASAAGLEISGRADIRGGSGKPVNDVLGYGVVLRYPLSTPGWYVGATVDTSPDFDVEFPLTFLNLDGPDEDSVGTSTMIMAFAERRYGEGTKRVQPFWSLGLGINSIDVDPLVGVLDNGDNFDLRTDAGTETVLEGSVGLRLQFGPHWSATTSLMLQHRIADWSLVEQVSGATTTVDDYTMKGIYFGLGYRF